MIQTTVQNIYRIPPGNLHSQYRFNLIPINKYIFLHTFLAKLLMQGKSNAGTIFLCYL